MVLLRIHINTRNAITYLSTSLRCNNHAPPPPLHYQPLKHKFLRMKDTCTISNLITYINEQLYIHDNNWVCLVVVVVVVVVLLCINLMIMTNVYNCEIIVAQLVDCQF